MYIYIYILCIQVPNFDSTPWQPSGASAAILRTALTLTPADACGWELDFGVGWMLSLR